MVSLTVTDQQWSGPVDVFKVFTFHGNEDVIVQLEDCVDRAHALAALSAC